MTQGTLFPFLPCTVVNFLSSRDFKRMPDKLYEGKDCASSTLWLIATMYSCKKDIEYLLNCTAFLTFYTCLLEVLL